MHREKKGKYRFAWRQGNQFRLLVNGNEFYPAMLEAIAGARHSVFLEMYLVDSGAVADRFIAALGAAAARGVEVRVLLDDLGAFWLRRADRRRLAESGVRLAFFNPLGWRNLPRFFLRDHRKILVVDGERAFTGGAGISDHFDPQVSPGRWWHETMLEIRGACVADWQALFLDTWRRFDTRRDDLPLNTPLALLPGSFGRLAIHGRAMSRSEILRSFVMQVRQARYRVWLATAYFLPPLKLRRAVQQAARRGVDVRLLLPGPRSDHPSIRHLGHRYYESLLRNGVRIFEYQPRFLHAKFVLCDDWASLGSSNLDRWNHRWNLEANQEFADALIAEQLHVLFENALAASTEIRYEDWRRRPFYRRWYEGALARIEEPMMSLSDWLRRGSGPRGTL
ncbi:phospholipase D-like domain-containing protein [Geoalkalibacter sp.]|uniref:phospholipase D-like domain-containing protein n=1 Tax=Geoalkalibacter sp. TaxID=3041440 RepID=UPI00272DC8BF|nr:phospholipase D-like domain-containing protein [Geoalkalibacter sp.]